METAQRKQEKAKAQGKNGLEALQARLDEIEAGAKGRLWKALGAGQHRLTELDGALEKLAGAHDDWTVDGLRKRLDGLRRQAEALRATALKRVNEMPATALTALAASSRGPVQNLARELDRLARLLEPRPETTTTAAEVEVIPPEPRPARAPKQKVEA